MSDAFALHDHARCQRSGMESARRTCAAQGLRLTPARECVLRTLLEDHKAMTAYELLERLRDEGLGTQPPVAYRALDFLVENGFVHRIERLSAFVACTHGNGEHSAAFFVCRGCRGVAETSLPQLRSLIEGVADRQNFLIEREVVEAEGICARCRCEGGPGTPKTAP